MEEDGLVGGGGGGGGGTTPTATAAFAETTASSIVALHNSINSSATLLTAHLCSTNTAMSSTSPHPLSTPSTYPFPTAFLLA